jgi:hypothetical protein
MKDNLHFWIGKIVQFNMDIADEWWVSRHYTDYTYEVVRVVATSKGPLIHMYIYEKLPGEEGRATLEQAYRRDDTVNAYMSDLMLVNEIINKDVVNLLDKEW